MPNESLAPADPVTDRLFHALAHPARRAMIERLGSGPATVSDLARPFAMSMPSLLQHIELLESAGIVTSAKAGRVRICSLQPGALDAAADWLARQRQDWTTRLDQLESWLSTKGSTDG